MNIEIKNNKNESKVNGRGLIGMVIIDQKFDIYGTFNMIKSIISFMDFRAMDRDDVVSFTAENDDFMISLYGIPDNKEEGFYTLYYNSYTDHVAPDKLAEKIVDKELNVHEISNIHNFSYYLAKFLSEETGLTITTVS
ncbi:hypothetical protein EUZ85_04555 [Hahella sp. KA22]|uniref:hypothetical protein n=1 Tax=Hahella sp. KA22 TaxID=1628392 RepID=UPI000FDDA682|nr:hypothetical protein [Hahella sp. KA22]AZZ90016.1 hypothetical protein ENC22_02005 [Hahella sp. KA22]QAY53386.1 hypothetical protein EUZ85_04555 [Hahella sp. KA22]